MSLSACSLGSPEAAAPTQVNETVGDCATGSCISFVIDVPSRSDLPSTDAASRISEAVYAEVFEDGMQAAPVNDANTFMASVISTHTKGTRRTGTQEKWFIDRRASIVFRNDAVITFAVRRNDFTGGAHGIDSAKMLSFDLRTGEPVRFDDVLQPGKEDLVRRLVDFELRRARTVQEGQSLRDAGFFIDDRSPALVDKASFGIVGDGIAVHYDPYEIGPYSLGPTDFYLPKEGLRAVLRHDKKAVAHLLQ